MLSVSTPLLTNGRTITLARLAFLSLTFVLVALFGQSLINLQQKAIQSRELTDLIHNDGALQGDVIDKYIDFQAKIAEAKSLGVDVASAESEQTVIRSLIFQDHAYVRAYQELNAQIASLVGLIDEQKASKAAEEAAKQVGFVDGVVKEGSAPLASVTVSLRLNSSTVTSTTTNSDGKYHLSAAASTYQLVGSKSGYGSYVNNSLTITAGETLTADFGLTKLLAKTTTNSTTTTTTNSQANGDSQYELKNVTVGGATYSVHVATFNLASGQFKVITDTANDNDCTDNCPVKSLSSYVSGSGGFAGMNGTYFCPADYSSCAGQVNSFFWKVLNTRLGKMINGGNSLAEYDPFIAFDSSGSARYFSQWQSYRSSGFNAVAGINCKPALISGGNNILDVNSLDDKQRNTKSNRGAIGLKGQVLYLVVAKGATVVDLADIMDALDVDYSFNLDGGGSSALIYNGAYKVGPGRSIPNAIIIARR